MTDWIATDLDGTLLRREQTPGAVAGSWRGGLPSSWVSAPAYTLLRALAAAGLPIVPVTARDADSYARVAIDGVPFAGAVIANGARLLLPDGSVDPAYAEEMAAALPAWHEVLDAHSRLLAELAGPQARARLVFVGDCSAYAVAKATAECWKEPRMREALAAWDTVGCHLSVQGPEVQILPPVISKLRGLLAFAARHHGGCPPVLALGDMPVDAPFMRAAAFAATPADSPLAAAWAV
jgi:hydroxymethylpyrimidine pyrophosphatase-like HAD family hydrolase